MQTHDLCPVIGRKSLGEMSPPCPKTRSLLELNHRWSDPARTSPRPYPRKTRVKIPPAPLWLIFNSRSMMGKIGGKIVLEE